MRTLQQPRTVDASVYLQVEPTWRDGRWERDANGELVLDGAKVARMTLGRPPRPKPGTVLVKVVLRLPAVAFLPLRPEAIVVVPEAMVEGVPLEVVAVDPGADGDP